jgi:phosphatidylinositol glycan class O
VVQPHFFSGSGAAEVPTVVRVLLISAAVLVPYGIRRVLSILKADNGIASLLLPYVFAPALIADSMYWLLESLQVDASGTFRYPRYVDLRRARTTLAWTSVVAALGGTVLCAIVLVALRVSSEKAPVALLTRRKCACSASPMPIGCPLQCSGRLGSHLSGSRRN